MTLAVADPVARIQSRIAEKLGPQRYKVWFKNATRMAVTNGYLRVGVPNLFVGSWIEENFADVISQAAEEVTGRRLNVSFAIDPGVFGSLRPRQLDSQAEYIAKNPERVARDRKRSGASPPARPLRGRLDEFVVGPANRLAYSAARNVVDSPASQFNPLFIHGGCGLGKTHLLQAVCNGIKEQRPSCRWAYASGEEFTNQFIFALKTSRYEEFRQRYRNLDLLVIDDIHFLARKKATQEEFLHTFNAIDAIGKQVVMASDSHPKMVGQLSESLVNRFVSGMVVRIDPPDRETRCEILRRRAAATNHDISEEVIAYIAESFEANVRELEGALLKLIAFSTVVGRAISLSLAHEALAEHLVRTAPLVRVSDIESVVATYFGLTPADLHTSRKTRTIALSRGIAMYLARKHTDMSFPEIGRFMGNKNHATVILACRKVERLLAEDGTVGWLTPAGKKQSSLRTILDELEGQLGKGPAPAA